MFTLISALTAMVSPHLSSLRARLRSDDGLEAVEYALLAALVVAALVAALTTFDGALQNAFNTIAGYLNDPTGTTTTTTTT